MNYLFFIVMLPLLASLVVSFIPGSQTKAIRSVTLLASGVSAILSLVAFCAFNLMADCNLKQSGCG